MTNSTSIPSCNEIEDKLPNASEKLSDIKTGGTIKERHGAFRTINEVADEINVPLHVLRFWETRFKQLKPIKRSDGQHYYRAEDISLLQYISELLYAQGYTIKGVQRLLDEDFSRFNNKTEQQQQNSVSIDTESSKISDQVITEQLPESVAEVMKHEQSPPQSVVDALEVARLKEENKLLIHSLQNVLSELQELRKIIAAEC